MACAPVIAQLAVVLPHPRKLRSKEMLKLSHQMDFALLRKLFSSPHSVGREMPLDNVYCLVRDGLGYIRH